MKVFHVITDTNIGGAGRYLLNLLSQPAFKQLDVAVACPDGDLAERMDGMGFNRYPVAAKNVSYKTSLTFELHRLLRAVSPDIVHTHSCLSGRIAARARKIPVVYTKHNLVRIPDSRGIVPPKAGDAKRLFNKVSANLLSDRIIAVSQGVEKELIESGIRSDMVEAIPNGIDLAPYAPPKVVRRAQDRGYLIGTVARLHRQKALDLMLEAFKLVLASEPLARLVIGGTGPLEDEIRGKVTELRLDPYVRMAGFVADVPSFLHSLDVYALSSDYEGLPLAVLEAMAAGLPIASTAVGGVPEAVVDGTNGILVPPRQPKALAHAMVRLLVDPDMARRMGEESRRRAEELFDAKIMAEKTVGVYRKVLSR